jgi:hypothetical protein
MPTQEEKVAHVEAALRRRFFHMVPKVVKPGREGWDEGRHDVDRLSRSLAAHAIASLAGIDDTTATGAITDGDDDFGIDALHYDRTHGRLFLVQSKFKRGGAAPSQEENLKTINGVKALMARRFGEFNASFQRRADEIEEALDTPGAVLEVALVFVGENMSPHVTNDLNALQAEINAPGPRMRWDWHGLTKVHGWLVADETPSTVTIDSLTLEHWSLVPGPKRALYGQLSAATLAHLVETHGKPLFERNLRHYLGSVSVNNAIAETASRKPADFFYLNNGMTAVADAITPAAGTPARCNFRLTNFSIVNGAQTAGSLATAAMTTALSAEAKVLITIIEIGGAGDDIGKRITKARNYQNAVRGIDFAALDPRQEHLRQVLAVAGITYHYRPSVEAKTRRDDAFTLEEAAVALACLSLPVLTSLEVRALQTQGQKSVNAVDFAVMAKKEVGRLWDQDGPAYASLFPADLSATRMCRAVRIYRFADQVLADTERAETTYSRRMFFRHGRYFIMAFLAGRSGDVLGRAELHLSADDRNLLSQRLNDLAELIFAESATWQGVKGYLAIFRNLTDAQPLADRVVARLAQRDRPPAPPPTANPVSPPQQGTGTT